MKKALDQTIRDLKRGVNKKVLKVPSIEQKVLDATSNEPWGPHGTLLADIAQATRNYHEYQMIMTVIWKRISSTGKNWRHVYKALTVLEYMVANGSERVVDDIREHAYQISTLSSFQYIDSSGRDQGLNVRRKSQSLVSLVNDKEKIQEVREKAAVNREKFRSSTTGGAYRPGSSSGSGYDEERYGYGREGEWGGSRDDDRYGRYADSYGRDGDRYGRDSEERYGRGSYKDEDSRGRSVDESQYGSRSAERDRDQAYDDEHHSSRGSSVKAEDHASEGRPIERKFSEQNLSAPPSYEDAIGGSKSPVYSERDGETPAAPAPVIASPAASASPGQSTANHGSSWSEPNYKADAVDEFDPRVPQPAVPVASNNAEMDLIGSLSDSLAITTVSTLTSADPDASEMFAQSNFMTTSSTSVHQSFDDPFGDSPFKAIQSSDDVATTQAQSFASASSFQPSIVNNVEQHQQVTHNTNSFGNLEVAESFSGLTFNNTEASAFQHPPNSQPTRQGSLPFESDDILAGILPPSGPPPPAASQAPFLPPTNQPTVPFSNAPNYTAHPWSSPSDVPSMPAQNVQMPPTASYSAPQIPAAQSNGTNTHPQMATGRVPQQTNNVLGDLLPQTGALALVPQPAVKEKFEPKSAVWADTLNRGLVNLDISGSKVNPNSDIGIDFDSLNRKEKRMEKPTTASATSTISMGKAMGSGSGMGRSGAGMIRPQSNPMMGFGMGMGMGGAPGVGMGTGMRMGGAPGVGMGMGGAPGVGMGMGGVSGVGMGMGGASGGGMGMGGASGVGMGMGGYGAMNQRPNMGMGMGGNMGVGMGMGMGMSQGVPMQAPNGLHPGANMSGAGGYNPMMGRGGYPQQPYGSGYQ